MMRTACSVAAALALAGSLVAAQSPRTTLDIYMIDVEGGQATLVVTPSGGSLLVDTGWSGFDGRDAERIASTAKQAGVSRIDTLIVTHYHVDHVGGVPPSRPGCRLAPSSITARRSRKARSRRRSIAYLEARAKGRHLEVKPGDTIPVADLDVRVASSGGALITRPLPGAGAANPLCASFTPKESDPTENARSVGTVLTFGRFRMLDLGDLTWNKEHDLVCPSNLLGSIDLYLTSHHGLDQSGSPQLVRAIQPRVAVMNNGAKKGGVPSAWRMGRDTQPGSLAAARPDGQRSQRARAVHRQPERETTHGSGLCIDDDWDRQRATANEVYPPPLTRQREQFLLFRWLTQRPPSSCSLRVVVSSWWPPHLTAC